MNPMSSSNKKNETPSNPEIPSAESLLEDLSTLEKELEVVEQNIGTASAKVGIAKAAVIPKPVAPVAAETEKSPAETFIIESSAPDAVPSEGEPSSTEEGGLEDFHAGKADGEPGLEEMLGSLKEDEPNENSILSQAIAKSSAKDESGESGHEKASDPSPAEIHLSDEEAEALLAEAAQPMDESEEVDETELQATLDEVEAEIAALQKKKDSPPPLKVVSHNLPEGARMDNKVKPAESIPGTLTMSMTGSMKIRLKYENEDQVAELYFEDGNLHVELSSGIEFKLPMGTPKIKANTKAA